MDSNNNISVKTLFANARGQLVGRYGSAAIASILPGLISLLAAQIAASATGGQSVGSYLMFFFITIIIDLLMGALYFGQSKFFLKIARMKEQPVPSELFSGFKADFDKSIYVQAAIRAVSVLFSIGVVLINIGIIPVAESEYMDVYYMLVGLETIALFIVKLFLGLSFYILADHPEYTVPEIFKESLSLMKGNKSKLLLTYICAVPFAVLGLLACGIGYIWFSSFLQTVLANFYLAAKKEAPGTPETSDENTTSDYSTSDMH